MHDKILYNISLGTSRHLRLDSKLKISFSLLAFITVCVFMCVCTCVCMYAYVWVRSFQGIGNIQEWRHIIHSLRWAIIFHILTCRLRFPIVTHVHIYWWAHSNTCTFIYICAYWHASHMCMHTHVHTQAHSCTHTNTHTHTRVAEENTSAFCGCVCILRMSYCSTSAKVALNMPCHAQNNNDLAKISIGTAESK